MHGRSRNVSNEPGFIDEIAGTPEYARLKPIAAARKLLHASNHGWTTPEIAQELKDRGVRSKSRDFTTSMYATLHLDDDFVRDAGKWFLKGVPRVKREK